MISKILQFFYYFNAFLEVTGSQWESKEVDSFLKQSSNSQRDEWAPYCVGAVTNNDQSF